jgi:DtxR family Mn-dependent transcriptional regulator
MKTLSSSIEDYLRAIYELQVEQGHERVSTSALADVLDVTRASVSGMLKKLAAWDPKLLDYKRYHGVELTSAGKKIAAQVIRHHRLLELYLKEALGYSWDEVHAEAHRLEHVISEEFEERIAELLGHPQEDPHGAPIPDRDGNLPVREEIKLAELEVGKQAYISRISDKDPKLLRYLEQIGFIPHTRIEVTEKTPFSGLVHIRIVETDVSQALGDPVTEKIFVTSKAPNPK